jgi:hypothetical protein
MSIKKITTAFILFVTGVCLYAQAFSWDIKFLKGITNESVRVNRIIEMEDGEEVRIEIMPSSDCFCYVLCYDALKQINVFYDEPLKGGIEKNILHGTMEEPSGTETIYVIMSRTRQTKLEELIRLHRNAPDSRQYANNLYNEVVSLQNAVSGLGEPPSVFIPGGGTSRGGSEEYVTRFSDKDLYVRTITIRH